MVREAFVSMACILLLASHAGAELTEAAKKNEEAAILYASMDKGARAAFAVGIATGMRTVFDISKAGMQPPEAMDIHALLNWCYADGHCRHVSPGAIALAAYEKPSVARTTLEGLERSVLGN